METEVIDLEKGPRGNWQVPGLIGTCMVLNPAEMVLARAGPIVKYEPSPIPADIKRRDREYRGRSEIGTIVDELI